MQYFFKQHEQNFKEWREAGYKGIPNAGIDFLMHLRSGRFMPKLDLWNARQWKKVQVEAIERCVYSFEVLGEKDLLTNIVTGGGKTTIIGAMIAYMMIVHNQTKFLILTPNTIVRSRLVDEFDPTSEIYIYNTFPFFMNSYEPLKDRISLHIMEAGASAAGVRSANIILGNIHQIYEQTDNWKVLINNLDSLVIFNDETHNTKAEHYNDLISKLKPIRFFRLDTTATPDRLDGLHPDSKMIFVYNIAEAMRDKIIKRIVVFRPDISKVKLTYKDLITDKIISAEEMPWEKIEQGKISPRRYITNTEPMKQQLAIGLELLKRQKMAAKGARTKFKPLLFVIAMSIKDAENIARELEKIGEKYDIDKILVVHNETNDERKNEARNLNKDPFTKIDAVVSVMMLREGWDVRNISVEILFRKFCYKNVEGKRFSVYGPQVVGRGLRRMNKGEQIWESLYVVDHPVLKHDWLWEDLKAIQYPESIDPANIIIDEQKLPTIEETIEEAEEQVKKPMEEMKMPNEPTPDPEDVPEPIYEWQKYLDEYKYEFNRITVSQEIKQIKSLNLDSEHVSLGKNDLPEIKVEDLEKATSTEQWDKKELIKQIEKQLISISRDALLEYDRNPDERQIKIIKAIKGHIQKRFLYGKNLDEAEEKLLRILWAMLEQIRDAFTQPELIEGILANNDFKKR